MSSAPLSRRMLQVLDDVENWIGDAGAQAVAAARSHVTDALRVAVVGRVKAGKSTLVNALLGRRIAPTGTTECTRVVTWYRYGSPDGAELVLHDGSRRAVPIVDGLPDILGVPLEEVDHLDVTLQARALKELTLIDTPGLFSLTREREEATRAAVIGGRSSAQATGDADAVVFVFGDVAHADEVAFLRTFVAATGELGASAVNAVGVLSRADEFGQGAAGRSDPIELARERAAELAVHLSREVTDVVAVSGLLAETARTGQITETRSAALGRLAQVDDTRLRLWERLEPHRPLGVDDMTMRTLLRLLGPYGLAHGRRVALDGAPALRAWLDECGGVNRLEEVLQRRFAQRADALKAHRALVVMAGLVEQGSLDSRIGEKLASIIEQVRFEPAMHRINEVRAAKLLGHHQDVPVRLRDLLDRLLSAASPGEILGVEGGNTAALRAAALREAQWAQGVAATAATGAPNLDVAEAARVVSRSFLLVAQELAS